MGALAIGHHRDRSLEPAAFTCRLIGVEERRGRLDVVLEHSVRLSPPSPEYVRHTCLRVPGERPDALQDLEGEGIAFGSIENGAGLQERARHHRVPVDVRRAIDKWGRPAVACGLQLAHRRSQYRPFIVPRRILLPPQHIFFRVVVHLTRLRDIEHARNDRAFSRSQLRLCFFQRPRPVVAIVAEREIRIL